MRPGHFLFLLLVVSVGCRGSKYLANNIVPGSIPSDITDSKYVLLVRTDVHSRSRMVEKTMKKNYPAAFEVISEEELMTDKKYGDVNKYRYLVKLRYASGGTYRAVDKRIGDGGPSKVSYSDQEVFDRKENTHFPATNLMSHGYAQGMMLFCRAVKNK